MTALFERPFLIKRFDPRGGGIDFLGTRQINLAMLQEDLIPGINNATADLGTFFLGAWIPWKFRCLCLKKDFTEEGYKSFRQAMEVAIAYVTRDGSPGERKYKRPRRRMGTQHQPPLPGPLTFAAAQRTEVTSLYAAPLYGPSLRYLGLLQPTDAVAEDGTYTRIHLASEDEWTEQIVQYIESSLAASACFREIVKLQTPSAAGEALDELGEHGLHPCTHRGAPRAIKQAFLHKFFANDASGQRRLLTAALIRATVAIRPQLDPAAMLGIWYSNLLANGRPFELREPLLREHRIRWAVFQARQIQRTILELFLRCFELAVGEGCRDIDRVIGFWRRRFPQSAEVLDGTMEDLIRSEGKPISRRSNLLEVSRAWNDTVDGANELYDDMPFISDDSELDRTLRMLARWWLRLLVWHRDQSVAALLGAGQRERLPPAWFHRWIQDRLGSRVKEVLRDIFSDLIFAQHIKFALVRFDGRVQRLRFTLGDEGIVPTPEVGDKLGDHPVRMADRLRALIGILADLDVLGWDDESASVGTRKLPDIGAVGETARIART
jgi:hypothetical protein